MPKVSIIVPIYNVEKYLGRCMESLLNQTLKDIEIIMVDDGSPDNCPIMCDEYAQKDKRIKVIHKKNAGLGYARNSGLEIATGEYVAFVDSDDFVELTMYERLYSMATTYDADTVYCGFYKWYDNKKCIKYKQVEKIQQFKNTEVINLLLDFIASDHSTKTDWKYEMSVWHSLYSRKIIYSNHLLFKSERELLSEDLPFQLIYLRHAHNVIYIPETLYYYCLNNTNSLTHSSYDRSKLDRTLLLFNFIKDQTSDYDRDGLRAKRFLICYLRALLYGLAKSKMSFSKKLSLMNELNADNVWENVDGYPFGSLNMISYIIALLQRKKMNVLALIVAKAVSFIHLLYKK